MRRLTFPAHVDVDSAEHLAYFKAAMSEGGATHPGMSDEALKGMLAAQATWDAAMGWNAVAALKKSNDPSAIMVVLVGSGHVAYGLGIERQARQFFDGSIATLVPVPDCRLGWRANHERPRLVCQLHVRRRE